MKHPVKYAPQWAAEIVAGSHTEMKPDDPEQKIHAKCLVCGDEMNRVCEQGNARHWIEVFALTHKRLHA